MARRVRVEDVIRPFQQLSLDRERHDTVLLMSHLCAYRKTAEFAGGKRVLEIGCGTGYGAYYLGHVAADVVAVDVEQALIDEARRLFPRPNVAYRTMEAPALDFPNASFDVIGTFQVIEHIPEPGLPVFVREMARVLKPDGVAVVSTMNLAHNLKGGKTNYQKASFHVKEFYAHELRELLGQAFASVEILGLYPTLGYRAMNRFKKWGLDRWGSPERNPVKRFYRNLSTDAHALKSSCTPDAIDIIAICRQPKRAGAAAAPSAQAPARAGS